MKESLQPSILVVDDTRANIGFLLETLSQAGYRVRVAPDGETALEQIQYAQPDLVLLDVMMPGIDGFETCQRIRAVPQLAKLPVIFMTALADTQDKVRAFEAGADDYVTKPFQYQEVLARVRTHLARRMLECELERANRDLESRVAARTLELSAALREVESLRSRLQQENRYLKQEIAEAVNLGEIIGSSPALQAALRQVAAVAPTDTTVLIHGETGTGKELIARAVHEGSPRRDRPLIKLNCSAISAGLVESELFGHVKGAFTGATERRVGRFELADGGTLFLDEVSELPLDTQAKLLRVLQEREFEPVGSSKTLKVDVRVVAATNRDLTVDCAAGRFRSDLFYRLNVFPIDLPPLRERREDIAILAEHFMRRMARKLGKAFARISPDTLVALQQHAWPGNIRDLQNTIERAAVLSDGPDLEINWTLGPPARAGAGQVTPAAPSAAPRGDIAATPASDTADSAPKPESIQAIERSHIIAMLKRTRGVIEGPKGAARLLNMNASTTRFRMKKLGITRDDYLPDEAAS
ncbi:MAG TPA: sigma-54 dependent transcriptional regulator [Steroidobacteraceae bacterium]|nr:sigma-54 dependent transcriptional regulator [Steroidobacteraceae bacterium]